MESELKIYQIIQQYITDKTKKPEPSLQNSDGSTLFFILEMIDSCKTKGELYVTKDQHVPLSVTESENLILKILSQDFDKETCQKFLAQLYYSFEFFQKLCYVHNVKIKAENATLVDHEIQTLSDHELYIKLFQKNQKQNSFSLALEKTKIIIANLFPTFKPAYAIGVVAAALFFIWIFQPSSGTNKIYDTYFGKMNTPYEYQNTNLRGHINIADQSPVLDNLKYNFKQGMADYVNQNYSSAVDQFNIVSQPADSVYANDKDSKIDILGDYYFYYGLCYLAQVRTKNKTEQRELLKMSSRLLEKAKKYAKNNGDAKEHFFLGLSYAMLDETKKARTELEKISGSSVFSQPSLNMLKTLKPGD